MWTTIGGIDFTQHIPACGGIGTPISFSQTASDSAPALTFEVRDDAASYAFTNLDEVIVWNEAGDPEGTYSGRLIPSVPSNNIVQLTNQSGASGGKWATAGSLSLFSAFPGYFPVITFANTTYSGGNNTSYVTAITPPGHIHTTQTYMLSVYANVTTPLVNAHGVLQMQFQDGTGTLIGSPSTLVFTTSTGNQRMALSKVAPSTAAYVQVWFGGQATVSGANSGVIAYGTVQVEPTYFGAEGISYPTPDCNVNQADCATMPDGTTSRAVRLFSGFINDLKKTYIGPARTWELQASGSAQMLDDGFINTSYTNSSDAAIITDIINTYFAGRISINAPNAFLPSPLATGATVSSVSYSDNSLREALNGLTAQSNFIVFLDQYYRLNYQPQFAVTSNVILSDTPDNVQSFPYYGYTYGADGTQLQRNVKVTGGNFTGSYTDTFSGNGTLTQFALTFIPDMVTSLTVSGTKQRQGVYGRDTNGGSIDVLMNTPAQYILFNTAPPNAANNVVVSYTYSAPITTLVEYATSSVVLPPYAKPSFTAKINDTNIVDLTTATDRGLIQIVQAGDPLVVVTCKTQKYAFAGSTVYFTSVADGILNQPLVVQSVSGTMIGKSEIYNTPVNEFTYTLGAYVPHLIDHFRNTNRALNRSLGVANATPFEQLDFTAISDIGYFDSITATNVPNYGASTYGTGHYGANSYS